MKLLTTGAEALLYADRQTVRKVRKAKAYRHPELDRKLRTERMHREANLLEKFAKLGFPAPRLLRRDEEHATIIMERINGRLLRDVLERSWQKYAAAVGRNIATLHAADIIHGDLTTSNMMVRGKEIVFIDFGLSFTSPKVEDKAVDLHLLRQALDSKHQRIAKECYAAMLRAYQKRYAKAKAVFARLEQVERRGRYKGKTMF